MFYNNMFKVVSGNYDSETTYTWNYETDYYDTLNKALDAYLKGKTKIQ